MRPVEDIERELALVKAERDALAAKLADSETMIGLLSRELGNCEALRQLAHETVGTRTAERDALARHVECLRAPVTTDEARAFSGRLNSMTVRLALDEFLANRQKRGQLAALS